VLIFKQVAYRLNLRLFSLVFAPEGWQLATQTRQSQIKPLVLLRRKEKKRHIVISHGCIKNPEAIGTEWTQNDLIVGL
jgi:hypothetical protein